MHENSLILQSKSDQLLEKVEKIKACNLAQEKKAKLEEKLQESRKLFTGYFVELSWKFFKISKDQLKGLDEEELAILSEAIVPKARFWAAIQQALSLLFIVPFVAIAATSRDGTICYSWHYLYHRKVLKNNCGDKYFPLDNLLKDDYTAGGCDF